MSTSFILYDLKSETKAKCDSLRKSSKPTSQSLPKLADDDTVYESAYVSEKVGLEASAAAPTATSTKKSKLRFLTKTLNFLAPEVQTGKNKTSLTMIARCP